MAAIVVAAGQGARFGGLKQFADLDNETVARRSVRGARSVASKVVLVVPEGYDGTGEGADVVVTGGRSRADSVRCGLVECADADVVVVHDAARPLASPELFHLVVDAVKGGAGAAVPGLSITDTVKRVRRAGDVTTVDVTLEREDLVTVQTPQAFRRELLERAHEGAEHATDDAALVEMLDEDVVVVAGEPQNIKITSPSDLRRVLDTVRGPQ
ncbi:MAG: IspD/TarI family cytidylyltransferase [Acidimicrobiales bacterium]